LKPLILAGVGAFLIENPEFRIQNSE